MWSPCFQQIAVVCEWWKLGFMRKLTLQQDARRPLLPARLWMHRHSRNESCTHWKTCFIHMIVSWSFTCFTKRYKSSLQDCSDVSKYIIKHRDTYRRCAALLPHTQVHTFTPGIIPLSSGSVHLYLPVSNVAGVVFILLLLCMRNGQSCCWPWQTMCTSVWTVTQQLIFTFAFILEDGAQGSEKTEILFNVIYWSLGSWGTESSIYL